MKFFTYNDYIDYNQNRNIRKIVQESAKWEKEEKLTEKEKRIEKITELIIKNKKENVLLINDFFNTKNKAKYLEWVDIEEQKKNIKILKEKNEEKYYILNYIIKKDNNIIYKIFKMCIELINIWKDKNEKNKYPIIYPIIIYLGDEKWDIKPQKNKLQYTKIKSNCIFLSYNIINFNKESKENLLTKKSLLSNIMAIKNQEEKILEKFIEKESKTTKDTRKYQKIKSMYYYLNYKNKN